MDKSEYEFFKRGIVSAQEGEIERLKYLIKLIEGEIWKTKKKKSHGLN